MDAIASTIAIVAGLYAAAGLVTAVAFVVAGVTAVQRAPVTLGARILLLPGAAVLWPLVLSRWLQARRPQARHPR